MPNYQPNPSEFLLLRRANMRVAGYIFIVMFAVTGCESNEAAKASLFEDDHFVADHWPSGLSDLSDKLRKRVAVVSTSPEASTQTEIEDLIGWVGEVAADTNLSEKDWQPLYERSEAVSARLLAIDGQLPQGVIIEIQSLCSLIDDSVATIPTPDLQATGDSL